MSEAEVTVLVKSAGFDTLAAEANKAETAIKSMGAAVRGINATGSAAAKATNDLTKAVNGTAVGTQLGNQIRASLSTTITNGSFWSGVFSNLGGRFRTFGQTLGRNLAAGVNGAVANIRNMNGGNGPSHTDLIGGAVIGGLTFKGVEDLVQAAAERQGARYRLFGTSLATPPQRQALEALADRWSHQFGNISTTEGLDFLTDSLQIFGGTHELFSEHGAGAAITPEGREAMTHIAGLLSYSKAYQAATGKGGNPEAVVAQFAAAIRSGEIKGLGSNPIDLANWVEKLTKVQLATGVDPTTFLQAQRAAGLSFLTMNDDAIYKFAAMVQEQNSRAGVMAATGFMHMIGGGSQTVRSSEAMRALGFFGDDANVQNLARQGKLELNRGGQIKHINDMSIIPNFMERARDPYKWYADTLYPAVRAKIMKDNGVDIGDTSKPPSQRTLDDIVHVMESLGAVFKNRNEANEAAESIIQAPQLERRAALVRTAQIDEQAAQDLIVKQTQDFAAAMNDLKVNLGQTILPTVTSFLKGLTSAVRDFGDFAKQHPDLTGGLIKWGGGALMLGGGLAGAGLFLSMMKLPLQILKSIGILGISAGGGLGMGLYDAAFAGQGFGNKMASRFNATGRILRGIGVGLRAALRLGSALLLLDGVIGHQNMKDIGSAVWSNFTGDRKGTEDKWKALDQRFKTWLDGIFGNNSSWRWVRNRVYGADPSERGAQFARSLSSHNLPALERWNNYLGYGNQNGQPWHWQTPPATWTPRSYGRGAGAFGGAQTGPVPVVIQSMPKGSERPNNVTTNVTVNVQTNASPQAIGGAVGSAVQSKLQNALSDTHD